MDLGFFLKGVMYSLICSARFANGIGWHGALWSLQ